MPNDTSIGAFLQRLDGDLSGELKTEKRRVIMVGVLILFVCCYMTWLYVQVGKFDAQWITGFMGEYVEQKLPDLQAQAKKFAANNATELADAAGNAALEAPHKFRVEIESHLNDTMAEILGDAERKLDSELTTILERRLADLKTVNVKGSPEVKMEAVLSNTLNEFKVHVTDMMEKMHPKLSFELERIDAVLKRLRDEKNLTPEEQIQREIVYVTVAMIPKGSLNKLMDQYKLADPQKLHR